MNGWLVISRVLVAGGVMCWLAVCQVAVQQQPKPGNKPSPEQHESHIRVDSTLVLVPVSVRDAVGHAVTGLEREDFKVFEDRVEQEITQFSSEDAPISIGIVFDASGSMGSKLAKSRQAVAEFLRGSNPEDEFFLIQFNDQPELTVEFTSKPEEIQSRLAFVQSKARTSLLDAIYQAMNQMKKARHGRKAILVISDGGDNSSRYTEREIMNSVREADVQIYAIGIFEPYANRGRTVEEMNGPELLQEVAAQTGGRSFQVENLKDLPDTAVKIGMELRNQYVLGYSPRNRQRDGRYRRILVRIVQHRDRPPLVPTFRLGYFAPSQ